MEGRGGYNMTEKVEQLVPPHVESMRNGTGSSDHPVMFSFQVDKAIHKIVAVPSVTREIRDVQEKRLFDKGKTVKKEVEVRRAELLDGKTLRPISALEGGGKTLKIGRDPDVVDILYTAETVSRNQIEIGVQGVNKTVGVNYNIDGTNPTICTRLESKYLADAPDIKLRRDSGQERFTQPIDLEDGHKIVAMMGVNRVEITKINGSDGVVVKEVGSGLSIETKILTQVDDNPVVLHLGKDPADMGIDPEKSKIMKLSGGLKVSRYHGIIRYSKGLVVYEDVSSSGTNIKVIR